VKNKAGAGLRTEYRACGGTLCATIDLPGQHCPEQSTAAVCSHGLQEEIRVRYFFNIRDGERTEKDLEGSEFDTLELAIEDARLAAREIMAEHVLAGYEPDGQFFDIADEEGRVLVSVPFRSALRSKSQ
jgi:hypothetical protein